MLTGKCKNITSVAVNNGRKGKRNGWKTYEWQEKVISPLLRPIFQVELG